MSLITFPEALKLFRRGCFAFPDNWRALAVACTTQQRDWAYNRARDILERGPLQIKRANSEQHKLWTAKGGVLHVMHEDDIPDKTRANWYTQIMWLYPPRSTCVRAYLKTRLRSDAVMASFLLDDDVAV